MRDYNTELHTFPGVSGRARVYRSEKPMEPFEATAEAQTAPKVSFAPPDDRTISRHAFGHGGQVCEDGYSLGFAGGRSGGSGPLKSGPSGQRFTPNGGAIGSAGVDATIPPP